MTLARKSNKTYWCGRCRHSKPLESMSVKKFCCCLSCDSKSNDTELARDNESPPPLKRVAAHTVQHKKAMNNLAYMRELSMIDDINGHLYYE